MPTVTSLSDVLAIVATFPGIESTRHQAAEKDAMQRADIELVMQDKQLDENARLQLAWHYTVQLYHRFPGLFDNAVRFLTVTV